jgi:hypothetical protein
MRITKAHDYDLTGELVEGIDVPQTGSARQAAGAELVQIS